jgi:hypothetical protein
MPLSRWGIFLTHLLTGVAFYIPVALAIWLFSYKEFFWDFLCLFFSCFSIGTFGAMLAGNMVGAVSLSGAALGLPLALRWSFEFLYRDYLPGVGIDNIDFFTAFRSMEYARNNALPTLSIVAACLIPISFALFLLRKPEKTGAFSLFSLVRYLFGGIFAMTLSIILFDLFGLRPKEDYWVLFLFIPVFYFVAAMLAEKRFMVFHKWNLLTLGILAAVFFNSIWMVRYDLFGIVTYVPDPKQVKSVEIRMDEVSHVDYDIHYHYANFYSEGLSVYATEDIALVTEAHEMLLPNAAFEGKGNMVYLTYTMKSGIKVRRYYPILRVESTPWEKLNAAVSTNYSIFDGEAYDTFKDRVYYIEVERSSNLGRSYYFTDDPALEVPGGDVKLIGSRLRNHFLSLLRRDSDKGWLNQLNNVGYYVIIKYRDDRGRECTKKLIIPSTQTGCGSFLNICWDSIRGQADRTITDSTPLYRTDISFNADGSGTSHTYPYYIID